MTTRAYQETYLSKAQAALGDAFDYAINTCRISGADFIISFKCFLRHFTTIQQNIIIQLVVNALIENDSRSFHFHLPCSNSTYYSLTHQVATSDFLIIEQPYRRCFYNITISHTAPEKYWSLMTWDIDGLSAII